MICDSCSGRDVEITDILQRSPERKVIITCNYCACVTLKEYARETCSACGEQELKQIEGRTYICEHCEVIETLPRIRFTVPNFVKKLFKKHQPESVKLTPIERMFWDKAKDKIAGLVCQYQIEQYRADFAIPAAKVVIELDGHDYHKTKDQRTRDARRQRHLELLGWRVFRFTGSEIYRDVDSCVQEAQELIKAIA